MINSACARYILANVRSNRTFWIEWCIDGKSYFFTLLCSTKKGKIQGKIGGKNYGHR